MERKEKVDNRSFTKVAHFEIIVYFFNLIIHIKFVILELTGNMADRETTTSGL